MPFLEIKLLYLNIKDRRITVTQKNYRKQKFFFASSSKKEKNTYLI